MMKAGRCNEQFLEMAWDVFTSVWHERTVPKEWVDAIIVHIPKKDNLGSCDNWQGISPLEVVGKELSKKGCRGWPRGNCRTHSVGLEKGGGPVT